MTRSQTGEEEGVLDLAVKAFAVQAWWPEHPRRKLVSAASVLWGRRQEACWPLIGLSRSSEKEVVGDGEGPLKPPSGLCECKGEHTCFTDGVLAMPHVTAFCRAVSPMLQCGAHHEGIGRDASRLVQRPLPQFGGSQVAKGRAWEARIIIWLSVSVTFLEGSHLLHL